MGQYRGPSDRILRLRSAELPRSHHAGWNALHRRRDRYLGDDNRATARHRRGVVPCALSRSRVPGNTALSRRNQMTPTRSSRCEFAAGVGTATRSRNGPSHRPDDRSAVASVASVRHQARHVEDASMIVCEVAPTRMCPSTDRPPEAPRSHDNRRHEPTHVGVRTVRTWDRGVSRSHVYQESGLFT
jgi:hypothetical protein